jgi:ATP-dependent phosphoenolpyruvate carboxykinase
MHRMRVHIVIVVLLALACACEVLEFVNPCKLTEDEIKEAKLSLETIVLGLEKPFPLGELAYSGRTPKDRLICKCKHTVKKDEKTGKNQKFFEECSDERWNLLAQRAVDLHKESQ